MIRRRSAVLVLAAVVTAGAGATLAAVDDAAAGAGLAFGVDLGARQSATVGGMRSQQATRDPHEGIVEDDADDRIRL